MRVRVRVRVRIRVRVRVRVRVRMRVRLTLSGSSVDAAMMMKACHWSVAPGEGIGVELRV